MKRLFKLYGLLLMSTVMLTACVSKPVPAPGLKSWVDRQQDYTLLTSWELRGRLGLRSKNESGAVTVVWQESGTHRQLRLLGPAGQGLIKLDEDASGTVIHDRQGQSWQGATPEALLSQVTGWDIPLTSLRWWVLGIVEPDSTAEYRLDEQDRLASLKQDGWQVSFSKYRHFDGYELPGTIVFQSAGNKDDDTLRGKLILKEWNRSR